MADNKDKRGMSNVPQGKSEDIGRRGGESTGGSSQWTQGGGNQGQNQNQDQNRDQMNKMGKKPGQQSGGGNR